MRALLLAVIALPTAILAKPPVATTEYGKVAGASEQSVDVFRGIPFAAPPVGANRWRAPQPPAKWKGLRNATSFGPDCMQIQFPGDQAPLRTTPSEDCLYLNLWKPAAAKAGAKLPVLVWIYGGAFMFGGTSPEIYDGKAFAKEGVIFVSLNYRVGRFGFFSHPALTAEAGKPVGNFAMQDQVAALQWVRNNISRFGGDPARVTVMGESAGGTAVVNLLTMPSARGLLSGAIVMSGGGRSLMPTKSMAHAEQVGINFAAKNGIAATGAEGLAAMRALPAQSVRGTNLVSDIFANPSTYTGGFMAEGSVLTGQSDDLMDAGAILPVPVMIGSTNADEGITFAKDKQSLFSSFGNHSDALRRLYDADGTADFRTVSRALTGDHYMAEPARFVARHAVAAGQKAFFYRFGYVAEAMRSTWRAGAPHATDIPYFFNTIDARHGASTTEQDRKAARLALAYVVNFARKGDPNGPSLPIWPAYDRKGDALLQFDINASAEAVRDPAKDRLDALEAVATHP
ncbi:carboxylesterase/lipase family protein [Novosphingobium sp.]|uniref:carboxylesterase/lipase family protein n=1 Tax=Novosphingobium sp. TaxID=1874826 RepID=UPI0035653E24